MTVSIDHVGISVPNIEKAIDWYKQTFDIFKISEVMEVNAESDEIASDVFDNKFNLSLSPFFLYSSISNLVQNFLVWKIVWNA